MRTSYPFNRRNRLGSSNFYQDWEYQRSASPLKKYYAHINSAHAGRHDQNCCACQELKDKIDERK